jgi:type IV pilus assembly protein PilX
VLYVALIMLILLALIGIVGMQVSGLQEKMSANYRNVNMAFQNAEEQVRDAECFIEAQVNRTASPCTAVEVEAVCDTGFDAAKWAAGRAVTDPVESGLTVRAISECIDGEGSRLQGVSPVSENPNPVYQITAYSTDTVVNPSADAAVDTIFRP